MPSQESFNKYENLPYLPYNCISYLMKNNETIWRLLRYDDAKAYEKPDLTLSQKAELIYSGQENANDFRVFMDLGQDDSVLGEHTILRISVLELIPTNYVYGHTTMAMEIYTHYKLNTLANYTTRLDTILQQLIATFNGAEITGLGQMYFDARSSSKSRTSIIGTIPYKGKAITMCNHMLG
jgi:hypothetical protein